VQVRQQDRRRRRATLLISCSPSERSPLPASSTIRVSPAITSTQLVLPPTRAVLIPGAAIEPRTP
jgi:hypothetical protein